MMCRAAPTTAAALLAPPALATRRATILTGSLDAGSASDFRSFFGFDLSGVTGAITGASITITTTAGIDGSDGAPSVDFGLYFYTGDYAALVSNAGGLAAFNALGGGVPAGVPNGSSVISLPYSSNPFVVTVTLDAAAVADLNASEGGDVAFGGALIGAPARAFIWGESGGPFEQDPLTVLTLTTAAAAPEPSTWAMMVLGFAGLGYTGYKRARGQRSPLA
jgi:hypothetical protein